MASWDATAFDAEVRGRASAPVASSSAPGWEAADIRRFANGELQEVAKRLRRVRTGYFRVQKTQAFTAGKAAYRFPTRAMHGVISLAQRLDAAGILHPLSKWTEGDMAGRNPTMAGDPEAYIIRGNSLVLYPVPDSAAQSLRFTYPRQPSRLAAVSTAGVVAPDNVNGNGLSLTMTATAASLGFTTSTPLDFLQSVPPYDSLADDATPTAVSNSSLQFAAGVIPSEMLPVAYGGTGESYFVCPAGTAPVFQLPTEAFYVLAQRVANMMLMEDPAARRRGEDLLKALEADLYGGAEDRDDAEADVVSSGLWP